jgi:hypothetical protein
VAATAEISSDGGEFVGSVFLVCVCRRRQQGDYGGGSEFSLSAARSWQRGH